ncbi:MAG: ribbon-helix-helix protein, CopG family [Candidatus Omnitrophica bacterium]|nr:ribbon-helix-helix protein, CopG family [Candidatus Omnitrophota bacterium]
MATKNPRLNVVLEPTLMKGVDHLAKSQGVSLSTMARDLIKEALDTHEDNHWQKIAEKRELTFSQKKSLSHAEVWK